MLHVGFENLFGREALDGLRKTHAIVADACQEDGVLAPVSRYLEERPLTAGRVGVQRGKRGMCAHLTRTPTAKRRARAERLLRYLRQRDSHLALLEEDERYRDAFLAVRYAGYYEGVGREGEYA